MHTFHPLRVADVREETDDTVSIAFAVPPDLHAAYDFAPGQHLTLRTTFDGEELRRSYSICSSPDDRELRVAVKHVPGGRFSGWVRAALRPGDVVDVLTPSGRFTIPLDPEQAKSYLAVAAGSGITPVISILKAVLTREPKSEFTLIYGNRRVSSIIFRDELDDLKNRFLDRLQVCHVLSREHQDVPLLSGRLDAGKLRQFGRTLVDLDTVDEVLLCGPEPLTAELRDTLIDLGVDPRHIHLELFGTPVTTSRVEPVDDGGAHEVTIVLNGVKTDLAVSSTASVLDAALQAGLDLPFSCKGGVCATCRARVCEGTVEMAANYALEPWEVEAGFVLTCQSRPTSERVVVDYDQA